VNHINLSQQRRISQCTFAMIFMMLQFGASALSCVFTAIPQSSRRALNCVCVILPLHDEGQDDICIWSGVQLGKFFCVQCLLPIV